MILAARFPAPRAPAGLSGPVAELPLLGGTLGSTQEAAFRRAGLRLVEGTADEAAPRVLLREDALARPEALRALVAAGRKARKDLRWSLQGEAGELARSLSLGRPDEPLLVWLEAGGSASAARLAAAEAANLPSLERALPVPVVSQGRLPITDRLVLPMNHWAQVLWANLLGLGPFLWQELLGRNPALALARLGWAALRSLSPRPERWMAHIGRRGRGCRVHPSAVVEASWLGEGVEVGAGAVVRAAVLGDGAVVEDQAMVEGCALGPRARVQRQAMAKYSVLGAGCAFAGTMQLGVLDAEAVVKHGAVLMDMALGAPVRVDVAGVRVDAPFGLLGVCVGRRATLSAGVVVAPGRVVPPELTVLPPSGQILRSIDPDLRGAAEVRDGRLVAR